MSAPEDYERGYYGHGRGVVVTQPRAGEFEERPMTAGEIAARAPAWTIGAEPYEFLTAAAAFVYYRAWAVIASAIDAALAEQQQAHDRRVSELLAANNREVEQRRLLQERLDRAEASALLWQDQHRIQYARAEALSLELRRLQEGQPGGHRRERPKGLVASDRVTGD